MRGRGAFRSLARAGQNDANETRLSQLLKLSTRAVQKVYLLPIPHLVLSQNARPNLSFSVNWCYLQRGFELFELFNEKVSNSSFKVKKRDHFVIQYQITQRFLRLRKSNFTPSHTQLPQVQAVPQRYVPFSLRKEYLQEVVLSWSCISVGQTYCCTTEKCKDLTFRKSCISRI